MYLWHLKFWRKNKCLDTWRITATFISNDQVNEQPCGVNPAGAGWDAAAVWAELLLVPFQTSAAGGRAPPASWCPPPWRHCCSTSSHLVFLCSTFIDVCFAPSLSPYIPSPPPPPLLLSLPSGCLFSRCLLLLRFLLLSVVFTLNFGAVSNLSFSFLSSSSSVLFCSPFVSFFVLFPLKELDWSSLQVFSVSATSLVHLLFSAPLLPLSASLWYQCDADRRWMCHQCFLPVAMCNAEVTSCVNLSFSTALLPYPHTLYL